MRILFPYDVTKKISGLNMLTGLKSQGVLLLQRNLSLSFGAEVLNCAVYIHNHCCDIGEAGCLKPNTK